MKKTYFISIVLILFILIGCSQKGNKNNASEMTFESELVHNFGTIPEGGDTTTIFIFKNTGKEALIITNVNSSCGCTVPVYPKDPVEAGKTGDIKVKFNTRNRNGQFIKSITVHSNAKNSPVVLKIKGEIN